MKLNCTTARRSIAGVLAVSVLVAISANEADAFDVRIENSSAELNSAEELSAEVYSPENTEQWDLEAPSFATIEQVFESIALDSDTRFALHAQPIVESDLLPVILSSIPEDGAADYEVFVEESGFDPSEFLTGVLIFSDDGMEELLDFSMIVGLSEETDITSIFEYVRENADPGAESDEDGDKEPRDVAIAFLIELSEEERALVFANVIETEENEEDEEEPFEVTELSDAKLGFRVVDDIAHCIYVWEAGAIVSVRQVEADDARAETEAALKTLLKQLSTASELELDESASELAIEMTATIENKAFELDVHLGTTTLMSLVIVLDTEDLEGVEQMISALPIFRSNPELLDDLVPEEYLDLAKIAIDGAEVSLQGHELSIELEVPTDLIEELLEDL